MTDEQALIDRESSFDQQSAVRYREEPREVRQDGSSRLALGLGWFSIGLGVAQLAAPAGLAKLIGVRNRPILMRFLGLREIASGIGVLIQPRPAGWLWSRVAGDAMDLALLGAALRSDSASQTRVGIATAAVAGVTALDVLSGRQVSRQAYAHGDRWTRVTRTTIVNRSPEECYRFWHDFENLPRFMHHLESVRVTGDRRSHWKSKAPVGLKIEWDAEIVDDQPNRAIAWRSLENADVEHCGSVHFEPATGNRGTIIRVGLQYAPPGGAIGSRIAKLFGKEPGQQIEDDLRAFKQIMETGEIVKSDSSIHRGMHAAQPPERLTEEMVR